MKSNSILRGVVAAYGLILPKSILESFPLGCFNLHASLLPRHRGASPIQALAGAVASCMSMDVAHVLTKGRHPLRALRRGLSSRQMARSDAIGGRQMHRLIIAAAPMS